jgi:hypothetical protein
MDEKSCHQGIAKNVPHLETHHFSCYSKQLGQFLMASKWRGQSIDTVVGLEDDKDRYLRIER